MAVGQADQRDRRGEHEQPARRGARDSAAPAARTAPASPPATRSARRGRAGSRARRRSAGTAADNASRRGRRVVERWNACWTAKWLGQSHTCGGAAVPHHRAGGPHLREIGAERAALPVERAVRGREQQRERGDRDDQADDRDPPHARRVSQLPSRIAPMCALIARKSCNKSSPPRATSCRRRRDPLYRLRNHSASGVTRRRILTQCKRAKYGQSDRDRPRHHQQLRRGDGRRQAQGHRKFGRRAHHAVGRRLHQGRRAPDRPAGQAPGGDQSRQYDFRGQAPDRPPLRRPDHQEGHRAGPLQDRQGQRTATPGSRPAARIIRRRRSAPSRCRR